MDQKTRLLTQLADARAAMQAVVTRVDPHQEIYPTWTIKQVLAHIAGWDEAVSDSLQAYLENDESTIPAYRGVDDYNVRSVETRQTLSYEQVVREWEIERERLNKLLKSVPDDKVDGIFLLPWSTRGTIAEMLGVVVYHEKEHALEINE